MPSSNRHKIFDSQESISTPKSIFEWASVNFMSAQFTLKKAAITWKAEGLDKEEAGEQLVTLAKLFKIKGDNIRVVKSRALTQAGYTKDIAKCVARASHKKRVLTPVDRILKFVRQYAKEQPEVIALLNASLIAAENLHNKQK